MKTWKVIDRTFCLNLWQKPIGSKASHWEKASVQFLPSSFNAKRLSNSDKTAAPAASTPNFLNSS